MPGKRHAISGPLNEHGDRDAIFDQLLQIARDPGQPLDKLVRRNLEYAEREPGCFAVKVHRDGRKMRGLKLQDDSQDPPVESLVCRHNRERGTIVVESQDPGGAAKSIQCFLFLSDPLRVEFWLDAGGEHCGDDSVATLLRDYWLSSVVDRLAKVPVSVQENVASPSGDWKSAMSDPLDAYFDYDKLLETLIEELRVPPEGFFLVTSKELPDSGHEQILNNGTAAITFTHRSDSAKGTVSVQAKHGGLHLATTCFAIHRDPLRLECWIEYEAGRIRLGSRCAGTDLRDTISRLLARAQRTCHLL